MFRILLVDDTRAVHAFVKGLLKEKLNSEFVDVFNGQEALDILKNDSKFDLVLLDWEMPVMTGPECLVEMKKRGVQIPIMMMTTKNDPSDIAQMLEAGASEYLLKPFTVDIIQEKIESICGQVFKNVG